MISRIFKLIAGEYSDSGDESASDPSDDSCESNGHELFASRTAHKLIEHKINMEPCSQTYFGALLIADISGLTRLSSRLTVEELKFHINKYFALMFGIVHKYYGDMLKFCGDRIIFMWPISIDSPKEAKSACVQLAIICASHLLNACSKYDRAEGDNAVSLRLHCGVGCGPIHCMCLGEDDRYEFLVSGDPLLQAGRAESNAAAGEVCLSAESASLVEKLFELRKTNTGNFRVILNQSSLLTKKKYDSLKDNSSASASSFKGSIISTLPLTASRQGSDVQRSDKSPFTSPRSQLGALMRLRPSLGKIFAEEVNMEIEETGRGVEKLISLLDVYNDVHMRVVFDFLMPETVCATPRRSSTSEARVSIASSSNNNYLNIANNNSVSSKRGKKPNSLVMTKLRCKRAWLRSMTHESIRGILDDDSGIKYIGEVREVVTLFIEVNGLEESLSHGLIDLPQKALCYVLNTLKRYQGMLRQYVVDDKGCVLIVAFGVPGACHEDDHCRAVDTAVDVRTLFTAISCRCRIGIASGKVYCGLVGSTSRCEYAMMGASVNLAARLMNNAKLDEIVVSEDVKVECKDAFGFQHAFRLTAKGYEKAISAYFPIERSGNIPLMSLYQKVKFVGRQKEMQMLMDGALAMSGESDNCTRDFDDSSEKGTDGKDYIDAPSMSAEEENNLPNDQKNCFIINGSVGVGKSYLLSELKERLTPKYSIFEVACSASNSIASYATIYQIFKSVFTSSTASLLWQCQNGRGNGNGSGRGSQPPVSAQDMLGGTKGDLNIFQCIKDWLVTYAPQAAILIPDSNQAVEVSESSMISVIALMETPILHCRSYSFASMYSAGAMEVHSEGWTCKTKLSQLVPLLQLVFLPFIDVHMNRSVRNSSDSSSNATNSSMRYSSSSSEEFTIGELDEIFHYLNDFEKWRICDMLIVNILSLVLSSTAPAVSMSSTQSPGTQPIPGSVTTCPMLVVEDLHVCDSKSLELLRHTLKMSSKCFFVGTCVYNMKHLQSYTSIYDHKYSQRHLRNVHKICNVISLKPFDNREVSEMVHQIFGERLLVGNREIISESGINKILERAGGSPYLTSALVLSMRSSVLSGSFTGINDSLSGKRRIIQNLFGKLKSAEQMVLNAASVINEAFDSDFLREILVLMDAKEYANKVVYLLFELEQHHLICRVNKRDMTSHKKIYAICDGSVRDYAYHVVLTQEMRETLHGAIGNILEEKLATRWNEMMLKSVVYHFVHSNNQPKRLKYLDIGACRDIQDNNFTGAIAHWSQLIFEVTNVDVTSLIESQLCSKHVSHLHFAPSSYPGVSSAPGSRRNLLFDSNSIHKYWLHMKDIHETLKLSRTLSKECKESIIKNKDIGVYFQVSTDINIANPFRYKKYISPSFINDEAVYCWIGCVAIAQYMLGHLHAFHNLAIFMLRCFDISVHLSQHDGDDVQVSTAVLCGWGWPSVTKISICSKKLQFLHPDTNVLVVDVLLYLTQVFLLRGMKQDACATLAYASSIIQLEAENCIQISEFRSLRAVVLGLTGNTVESELSLQQARTISSLKFPTSVTSNRIANSNLLGCSANFHLSLIYISKAIEGFGFTMQTTLHTRYMIQRCWILLLSGKVGESKMELQRIFLHVERDQHSPVTRWIGQLNALVQIVCKNSNAVLRIVDDVTTSMHREEPSATESVLKAVAYLDIDMDQCYRYVRYACRSMARKSVLSVMSGVFVFMGGYCSLSLVLQLDVYNLRIGSSDYADINHGDVIPSSVASSHSNSNGNSNEHKEARRRVLIKECVEICISKLEDSLAGIPCMKLLYCTLRLMYIRVYKLAPPLNLSEECVAEMNKWKEFQFGLAYFYQELSYYYDYLESRQHAVSAVSTRQDLYTAASHRLSNLSSALFLEMRLSCEDLRTSSDITSHAVLEHK